MRVAMLSCNTGEGHNSTAKAIENVLSQRGVQSRIVDVLACLSPRFSKFVCNWHVRLYKYAPKLWDASYRAFENMTMRSDERAMLEELLSLGTKKLRGILEQGDFDAVVCVHVFSAMMMTELRRVWGVEIPCYFVATDYTCCPYTDRCDLDGFFIPAKELAGEYIAAGLPKDRLIPSGIPVRQAFYSKSDKQAAKDTLLLSQYDFVALFMGGSMGCGPMQKITPQILQNMPKNSLLVAICGKNERLYEAMSEIKDPGLRVLGYCDQVPLYMDAADMIITKPGGLSATEAANKHLPIVFLNAIGGCESRNFDFFLKHGFAVGDKNPERVVQIAQTLAESPDQRAALSDALENSFRCNSAVSIADVVMRAAQQYRGESGESEKTCIERPISGNPFPIEGGFQMEKKGYQTILNLARSFAGESQARTRYTIFADVARKEGQEWIARIFEETAHNEAVHAKMFLKMLKSLDGCAENIDISGGYPYPLGTTLENLASAAAGELHEHDEAYPGFAEIARREGYNDAALLWMQIARIEGVHHNTFRQLHEQLSSGTLTQKDHPVVWRCLNCGYTYESPNACDPCPVCKKNADWQAGELNDREMMPKK